MTVLREISGRPVVADNRTLDWVGPDLLAADIPLTGDETILTTVHLRSNKNITLSPQCLPYCPEYQPAEAGEGLPRTGENRSDNWWCGTNQTVGNLERCPCSNAVFRYLTVFASRGHARISA